MAFEVIPVQTAGEEEDNPLIGSNLPGAAL